MDGHRARSTDSLVPNPAPRRSARLLLLFCATVPLACVPDGRFDEARALVVVGQLGGRTVRDSGRDGEPIGKVDLAGKPVTDADLNALSGWPACTTWFYGGPKSPTPGWRT